MTVRLRQPHQFYMCNYFNTRKVFYVEKMPRELREECKMWLYDLNRTAVELTYYSDEEQTLLYTYLKQYGVEDGERVVILYEW